MSRRRSSDEVRRALGPDPRIIPDGSLQRRPLERGEVVGQAGQLVDDDLGLGGDHEPPQRCGIEHVHDHRGRSQRAEQSGLPFGAGGSDDVVSGLHQQGHEALSDES